MLLHWGFFPSEKLNVLSNTGNPAAGCRNCPEQTVRYFGKNKGIDLNDPQEIQIHSFAPCTSLDVESFFSNLNHFVADMSNMTEAKLETL